MGFDTFKQDAIKEINKDLKEEKTDHFKDTLERLIREISKNNEELQRIHKLNAELRREINALDFEEPVDIF